MKIFTHTDLDGKSSGAIIYWFWKKYGNPKEIGDIKVYLVDYSMPFPLEVVEDNELVYISDFAPQETEDFDKLLEITPNIVWLDHHISAIEKYKYLADKVEGIRREGEAGCMLTWQYLYKSPMPKIIEMLGQYDIWDFSKYGDELLYLQEGLVLYDTFPTSKLWVKWMNNDPEYPLDEILQLGKIINTATKISNKGILEKLGFETEFEGYRAICCNTSEKNSLFFDSVKDEEYDLLIPFTYNGKTKVWDISLYTTKEDIDCSKIAIKYGGGGHIQASGFSIEELPFSKA